MQYSHTTGAGIIINAHKKLFDFKLIHWHDKTRIPEMDLLVEFRTDSENNTSVVYIKSSKYQEFSQDSIIKERDFWKTQTDEELEKLEIAVFEGLVEQTYKKTDYAILNNIKPSISVDSFIEYHFENETNIINHANDLPTDGYEILDYRIVARFLMRTLIRSYMLKSALQKILLACICNFIASYNITQLHIIKPRKIPQRFLVRFF